MVLILILIVPPEADHPLGDILISIVMEHEA
jgi:hypothetical protein